MKRRRPSPDARRQPGGRGSPRRTVVRRVRPTPFEARVYALVRRIPKGQTRSYQWVARQLGTPALARAVGQALHRNPCLRRARRGRQADPRRTPCHRVIRSDGTLGGYAWGVARKRRLLRRERALPA